MSVPSTSASDNTLNNALQAAKQLEKGIESISLVKQESSVVFDNEKAQFVARNILSQSRSSDSDTSLSSSDESVKKSSDSDTEMSHSVSRFDDTLSGIQSLAKLSTKTIKQLTEALALAKKDKDKVRKESAQNEISRHIDLLQNKLTLLESELKNIQKDYMKQPAKYAQLSETFRDLRLRLHENIGSLQKQTGKKLNYDRPFPFEDSVPLDKLPKEILESYALDLKQEREIQGSDSEFLKKADDFFHLDGDEISKTAQNLHTKFTDNHSGMEAPVADSKTNTVICTASQLKDGIKMLRENFPGLVACALTTEQKAGVSQLLQIILTGKALETKTDCCFRLRELENTIPPSKPITTPKGESSLLNTLKTQVRRNPEITEKQHLQASLAGVVSQFTKDSISRDGFIFKCGDTLHKVGPEEPFFLNEMTKLYTDYLLKSPPEKIKEIVEKNRNSDLFNALKTLDLPFDEGGKESVFPEAVLKNMLSAEISKAQSDLDNAIEDEDKESIAIKQNVLNQLNEISSATKMDSETIKKLVDKSGCDPRDIEPLIRMKALEIMHTMVQGNLAPVTGSVVTNIFSFQNPIDPSSGQLNPPKATSTIFSFDSGFEGVTIIPTWALKVPKTHHTLERMTQITEDHPQVATIASAIQIPSIGSKNITAKETPVTNPLFSWKTTNTFLDHILGSVNPKPLEDDLNKQLHEIQKMSEYVDMKQADDGSLTFVPSKTGPSIDSMNLIYTIVRRSERKFLVYANSQRATITDEAKKNIVAQGRNMRNNLENTSLLLTRISQKLPKGDQRQKAIAQVVKTIKETQSKLVQTMTDVTKF